MTENDTLWHYCSNDSFVKIIESRQIIMGETSHLNDFLEGKWLIEKVIKPELQKNGVSKSDIGTIIERINNFQKSSNAFVFCLSGKPDVLSQWRGYADDGCGVSIGFNKYYLNHLVEAHVADFLSEIEYDHDKQKEMIGGSGFFESVKTLIVGGALSPVNNGTMGLLQIKIPDDEIEKRKQLSTELNRILISNLPYSYLAKNIAFKEEAEWRMLYFNVADNIGAADENKKFYDPNRKDLKVTARHDKIVPGIICNINEFDGNLARALSPSILEVKLGPKNRSDKRTIEYFLERNGFQGVLVSSSDCSYQ